MVDATTLDPTCEKCGSALTLVPSESQGLKRGAFDRNSIGAWRYRDLLPAVPDADIVTLGEGGTPLLAADRLGKEFGLNRLMLKDESRNPTGSFIDRGVTVLVSLARSRGVRGVECETTGNLGASLAAYCAKAGIETNIRIRRSIDREKLYQMIAFGAEIQTSRPGRKDEQSDRRTLRATAGNPYILEGEKTTGFELIQDLGWKTPDVVVVPVGTGGHLAMIWSALQDLVHSGLIESQSCRFLGAQSIAGPTSGGQSKQRSSQAELTFAELEESEPGLRRLADRAMHDSGGQAIENSAAETVKAIGILARTEGIFAEPAAASVISSLKSARDERIIDRDEDVVCVVTGAGLKDTKAISRIARTSTPTALRDDYDLARLQVGPTKLEVLVALAKGSTFGYDLWKELSGSRSITTASVYQHLGELEGLGLVRRSGVATVKGRERVLYRLTDRGSVFLEMAGRLGHRNR
ncbi:MAG: pyridoxal-phosphate dependent enzyme [Thaumarchaeota archaeon]|nr:pyridoxal-phosphate dependent enzyme [Nitrososphaerota archaeon]